MWLGERISVILPTYNEKDSIRAAVNDFFASGVVDEVVVINNNAAAGTSEEVAQTRAREVHESQQGYGFAIRRGFCEATGDKIVVCEPDGTFAPRDVFKMLAYSDDFDVVYGSRTAPDLIWAGANMGRLLRWGNWLVAKLIEVLFNTTNLTDVGCTMRLVRRDALARIEPYFRVGGSHFGPEMMLLSIVHGLRVIQVPLNYKARVGISSVTGDLRKAIQLGFIMFLMVIEFRLGRWFVRSERYGQTRRPGRTTERDPRTAHGMTTSPRLPRRSNDRVPLACPACHSALEEASLLCPSCGIRFPRIGGVPLLIASSDDVAATRGVGELFEEVAERYDQVFGPHIVEHYLSRRTSLVRQLLPEGSVLDVGCGTGTIGVRLAAMGYAVVGVDLSPAMLQEAVQRGLTPVYAALSTALPFPDCTFDLALTVATLHHLETPDRVAGTIMEMARVLRPGGFVVLWDHNPLNPYWGPLMRRVPQDSGNERLVPLAEILADVAEAGLQVASARRRGLVPDFLPAPLLPPWRAVEALVEATPGLRRLAAHNVVVARKPVSMMTEGGEK
jgi:SAM-dependent methyltransferase